MRDSVRAIAPEPETRRVESAARSNGAAAEVPPFRRSWASRNGEPRPADVRSEQDAAIHLLLRMLSLSAVRVVSLLSLDVAALAAAVALTQALAPLVAMDVLAEPVRVGVLTVYSVLLGLAAMGAYGAGDPRRDPLRLTRGVLVGALGTILLTRLLDPAAASLSGLGLLALLSVGLVLTGRLGLDALTRSVSLRGYLQRRVLLIGDEASASAVLAHFNGSEVARLRVQGRLAPDPSADGGADGGVDELREFLHTHGVDVVLVTAQLPERVLRRVVTTAFRRGVRVELVPTAVRDNQWVIRSQLLFGCPVLEVRPSRLGVPQMALKRAFDLALATTLAILLLPVFALVALAIKLDSSGPILFRQTRAGLAGKPFTILKFRTMVREAEEAKDRFGHLNGSGDPRLFKIAVDPRVTRMGRLLRALSLDELPQLFNIIRGDMSFVGPRPFFREDFEHYEPHHFERMAVLPGLTGLWQVSGRSEIRDFESVVEMDQQYIRGWSLLLDFKIMLKTLPALIRRHGAF